MSPKRSEHTQGSTMFSNVCQSQNLSLEEELPIHTHWSYFWLYYFRLSSSKRERLKYLQLSIHSFNEFSRWSLGSLCPIAVYSDRMTAVHYQIISLPKGVAKLVNDKFGWATWITVEAILLCKNCVLCQQW